MDRNDEMLPIVDCNGKVTGCASRGQCHDGKSKILHPVVHLHVIDRDGRLLLQKRAEEKRIQPGKWDTAVGGHVDFGESTADALRREASEEIGFPAGGLEPVKLLRKYVFESEVERELVYCHLADAPRGFTPSISEPHDIDELRYWNVNEIEACVGKGVFTPNFEKEFITILRENLP